VFKIPEVMPNKVGIPILPTQLDESQLEATLFGFTKFSLCRTKKFCLKTLRGVLNPLFEFQYQNLNKYSLVKIPPWCSKFPRFIPLLVAFKPKPPRVGKSQLKNR